MNNIDELIALGVIDQTQATLLGEIIDIRQNILVAGGIGSGRTTLLQTLTNEIQLKYPTERVVLIQEYDEIKSSHSNHISLIASNQAELVNAALRMNPLRMVIGELKKSGVVEALINCTTPWISSITATSTATALHNLMQYSISGGYTPYEQQIAEQVHLIVVIEKTKAGHRITEISKVSDWDWQHKRFDFLPLFKADY